MNGLRYLCLIQARLGSKRFPNKVLQTVGGVPMVRKIWLQAKQLDVPGVFKTQVLWPERYPEVDENNVLERFQRIVFEYKPKYVIRITSDCPLITAKDIADAIHRFHSLPFEYYCNGRDGYDVQVFTYNYLFNGNTHREHVIKDFGTKSIGLSVNTKEDLERVRYIANGR